MIAVRVWASAPAASRPSTALTLSPYEFPRSFTDTTSPAPSLTRDRYAEFPRDRLRDPDPVTGEDDARHGVEESIERPEAHIRTDHVDRRVLTARAERVAVCSSAGADLDAGQVFHRGRALGEPFGAPRAQLERRGPDHAVHDLCRRPRDALVRDEHREDERDGDRHADARELSCAACARRRRR